MARSFHQPDDKELAVAEAPGCAEHETAISPGNVESDADPGANANGAPRPGPQVSAARWIGPLRAAFFLPTSATDTKQLNRWLDGGERPSEAALADLVRRGIDDITTAKVIGWDCPEAEREQLAARVMLSMAIGEMFGNSPTVWESRQVDIAASWAAFALLTGTSVPRALPTWMLGERDRFMETLAGERGRSTTEIRNELRSDPNKGPSERTFAALVAGGKPDSEHVVTALARLLEVPSHRLRVHYACRTLVDVLNASWGREEVQRWLQQLLPLAGVLGLVLGRRQLPPEVLAKVVARGFGEVCDDFRIQAMLSKIPPGAVRDRLDEYTDSHCYPPSPRLLLGEWWPVIRRLEPSPAVASLVLMALLTRTAGRSEAAGVDVIRERLRRVSQLVDADDLAEASNLLCEIRSEHPSDPRAIMMEVVLAGLFQQPAQAKKWAKEAARAGYPGLRAVLEGVPEALGLRPRSGSKAASGENGPESK